MHTYHNFFVDKITNSIEKVSTGKSFDTELFGMTKKEIMSVHKKDGWLFNWKKEFKERDRQIFKLTLKSSSIIQGLIAIEPVDDQKYLEIHLLENAPHNMGKKRIFAGVAGNLVAFACKKSFDSGYDGVISLTAKTQIIQHYEDTLGATLIFKNRMAIFPKAARKLVNSYYRNYINER